MNCVFGRTYDEHHPTCRSCRRQGIVCSKPKKAKASDLIRTWNSGQTLITTAYLDSLNAWHGRPRYVYTRIRKKWESVLFGTVHLWGRPEGRRRLQVRRFVKSSREMILDRDNLVGALKPLKDTLVRFGVLADDTDADVVFDIDQFVDRANPRVEVEVT